MSSEANIQLAEELLNRLGSGASPEEVSMLFSPDADWEIAGDVGALPWLGRQKGRDAVAGFVRDSREMIERIRFNVQGIVAGDERAVILGELASKVKNTGKVIETKFAIILNISGGKITHFRMAGRRLLTHRSLRLRLFQPVAGWRLAAVGAVQPRLALQFSNPHPQAVVSTA